MNWEGTLLLNVFSDLPTYFLKQCSEFSLSLPHLYHRRTKLHLLLAAVSVKWKVPPLLQYPYNYWKNCYILLQQLNDLSQMFDAMALACSRSHFLLHHQNQAWRLKQRSRMVPIRTAPYLPGVLLYLFVHDPIH